MQGVECGMLVLAVLLAACGSGAGAAREAGRSLSDSLRVEGPFAYAPPEGQDAAVYFTIHNPSDRPDTLVHVNAIDAAGVSYHRAVTEGGLVRMENLETLEVPAGDSLALQPGGMHIMLSSLKRRTPGDTIHLSLAFAHAGTRVVAVPVLAPGDEPAAHRHE